MTTERPSRQRPDVIVILADDMGYSDLGCFGSEIDTPHLDALAAGGVRMSQFYNTARCSPARASLLTGLHPHQTGIGVLTAPDAPLGYPGTINRRCVTMAEVLRDAGYGTYHSGKWHLTTEVQHPHEAWPRNRGFEHGYSLIVGGANYYAPSALWRDDEHLTEFGDDYYVTTAIGDEAAGFVRRHHQERPTDPLFAYVAFTAPHWPLHAPEEAIARYADTYQIGWDAIRAARHARQQQGGLIDQRWPISPRDPRVPAWDDAAHHDWQARRMAVYAAQVTAMDTAVGEVVSALRDTGRLDNTLIMFLSDNGGCSEEFPPPTDEQRTRWEPLGSGPVARDHARRGNVPEIVPGPADTHASYGIGWANVSNTPFREYKHWVHEGGIATPLIAHWPARLAGGIIDHRPRQLPDIMATVLAATGADYPDHYHGNEIPPPEGTSMLAGWQGANVPDADHELFFEHEGNAAMRRGRWKLVRKYGGGWELYDIDTDRTELTDVAADHPDLVIDMIHTWQAWADRCGVIERAQVISASRGHVGALLHFNSNPRVR